MKTSVGIHTHATRRHAGLEAIAAILVTVVLSLVGGSVVANAADQLNISITSTFSPANATVQVGTTVTWTNNDSQSHELRSTAGPTEFRTNPLAPGQSASVTFNSLGTYTYVDHQNDKSPAYRGIIVVTDHAVPTTPPATTPPPGSTPAAPLTAAVRLAGAQFAPATVTVGVGGTVTWSNDDASKHTVTADNGSFDSGSLSSGGVFSHTFTAAGTYAYGCDFHGNMRGTVIVTGTPTTPAPAPSVPAPSAPVTTPPAAPPGTPTPPAPAPGSVTTNETININNNVFSPATISVNVGSTVNWANVDTVTHTATADDQSFASGLVRKNTTWSHTFNAAGTFTYFCEIHPEMTGTVITRAPDGGVPPAAAPTSPAPTPAPAAAATSASTAAAATSAGSSDPSTGSISITDSGFTPATFRVALDGTLSFVNNGKAAHTVTAGDGSFDSDMIRSGGTWEHTFTTAGTFVYSCILHPNMKGTVQVAQARSGSARTSQSSASPTAADTSNTQPAQTASPSGASTAQPVSVDVADNQFNPNAATVAVGGTVTWKLSGEATHTVTSDDESFNSGLLKPGETYQYTFDTLGAFTYVCLIHPGMNGTINVVPPDQAAAQLAAPQTAAPGASPGEQASGATASSTASPAHGDSRLWGNTLLGIAAALLACCALIFTLKSFLKILTADDSNPGSAGSSSDSLSPTPI